MADLEGGFTDQDSDLNPWWFASFGFPVLAGTFGPIATAFSICATLRPWVLADAPRDPTPFESRRFLVLNATQLGVAVVSHLVLLFGMARKIPLFIAQLTTTVGYYISSFCLVALIVSASRFELESDPEPRWSQSYYYCLYAAIIYFVLASFLLANILGASLCHYKQDVALSTALRTLLLNTVIFLSVLFLGALIFSHVEGWAYLDAIYWADVTLLTIGFGDISPETTLGRALLFPYTLLGIVCLGVTLVSIRRLVLDRGELGLRKRRLCKMRDKFFQESENHAAFSTGDRHHLYVTFAKARDIRSRASRKWRWTIFALSSGAWLVLLFGGAAVFVACERPIQNWVYFDGLYMAFISLTTIGYGNLTPISSSARSFFVLWSLLGVPTITILISNAEDTLLKLVRDITIFFGGITILPGQGGFGQQLRRIPQALGFGNGCRALHDSRLEAGMQEAQTRKLPSTRLQFCVIIFDEIVGIIRHLSVQPQQHFSFDQWLWLGKLLEGVESFPETQQKQSPVRQQSSGQEVPVTAQGASAPAQGASAPVQGPAYVKLGIFMFGNFTSKSPLMGPKEEAEWFLERLIEALKRELGMLARQETGS